MIKEKWEQMKFFATDLQMFFGTHQMIKATMEKIESFKSEILKDKTYALEIKLHPLVSSLMNDVKQFGETHITETNSELQLKDAKIEQAQIQVRGSMRNIIDNNPKLKLKFDIKSEKESTGCLILSDGRILIADIKGRGKLMEYDDTGEYVRDIQTSNSPYDITEIDIDCIAATYPGDNYLNIINIKDDIVVRKIECRNKCFGISYHNGKIITLVKQEGIIILDPSGTKLNILKIDTNGVYYITGSADKVYYIDEEKNTVTCCNFEGQNIWIFKNDSIRCPRGITKDKDNNVYVVGSHSNNLTLIKDDGKTSNEILTANVYMDFPYSVCYDKRNKLLLVGIKAGSMAMFQM